ncbi:hypothetical protein B5M42_012305 [Paenibacillus athensensis]|uniref:Carrier domain-containing protein n=1 Tax=Paenibacillus athensensis TaxID=1967502 RepID=A0A4Y8Q6F2_9BACL|nr:hypothetical protein [Paenibacillus athensensis]MCD1259614.1 hypothetical protein [Paenibacillus athensensis]
MVHIDDIKRKVLESSLFVSLDQELGVDEELNLDSMSLMWLISELEELYRISIDYRVVDLQHFRTIRTVYEFVDGLAKEVQL